MRRWLARLDPFLRTAVFSGTSGAMRLVNRLSLAGRVLGVVCAVLAVCSAVWLARADERLLNQVPKRLAQGRELRLEHHMALGFHRAAWAGLVIGMVGMATAGWWGRRPVAGVVASREAPACSLPAGWLQPVRWREVAVVALAAMALSGALRWPRLGHSFWSDEAYAARAYVWGMKVPEADGRTQYMPVTWTDALFLNERANNQVWCSIEARVAHGLWRATTGAPADTFSERVLRLPSFLWGLLTVGVVSVLGAMLAGRGGAVAGLLLAVHPWHVRFAAEMRGYSAMLFAIVLGILFLLLALRDGRWRWWLLNAAANLWALLAFAGSAHVPLVCCGAAAAWLVRRRRWDWLARLVLANALVAVAFLWVYGPSITQLKAFLARGTEAGGYTVSAAWLRQFGESLCLGVPWSVMSDAWHRSTVLPSASAAAAAVAAVALLAGVRVVVSLRFQPRLLVIPGLLAVAGVLSIAQSLAAGTLLLMWYLLPVVIGWVLLLGAAPEPGAVASGKAAKSALAGLQWLTVVVCLVVWAGISVAMVAVPRQPMREAGLVSAPPARVPWIVRLCTGFGGRADGPALRAPTLGPAGEERLLGVAGISDGQMKLYAPQAVTLKSGADMEQAEARAAAEGKKLWVSVGGWEATRARSPEIISRLTGGTYEKVADLPGWEPMFSYQVWRQQ